MQRLIRASQAYGFFNASLAESAAVTGRPGRAIRADRISDILLAIIRTTCYMSLLSRSQFRGVAKRGGAVAAASPRSPGAAPKRRAGRPAETRKEKRIFPA